MKVIVKGIQKGDDLEIELTRKLAMIDQVTGFDSSFVRVISNLSTLCQSPWKAVTQHSTESSMGQFKSTLGPLNAGAMEWPVFRGMIILPVNHQN